MAPDPLHDFTRSTFTAGGITKEVLRAGSGPAVIVIHEIPGITPEVANFARRVAANGLTAVCPVLVGKPGAEASAGAMLSSLLRVCVSREFTMFTAGKSSAVVDWLRPLARDAHERCGGPGVGVVGMCFSGGFALAMADDPIVLAPVMSQPSFPVSVPGRRANASGLDSTREQLAALKDRFTHDEDLCVLGYRFTHDKLVPEERFARLRSELGERFHGVSFDSSPGNPEHRPADSHSVLSRHLVESAAEEVVAFLRRRLLPAVT